MYTLCNVAYFAAGAYTLSHRPNYQLSNESSTNLHIVPKEEIMAADQTAATLFFSKVFGEQAAKGLNILVIISAFGNLVSNLIGQSRMIREIGR